MTPTITVHVDVTEEVIVDDPANPKLAKVIRDPESLTVWYTSDVDPDPHAVGDFPEVVKAALREATDEFFLGPLRPNDSNARIAFQHKLQGVINHQRDLGHLEYLPNFGFVHTLEETAR